MDRGVARRTLFETKRDIRTFFACLARQVRSGDLEVHAFVVLTTHFHLLVRSPRGELSRAMQRALDAYARWFNRGRRRDGPLFRGRFVNRIVETEAYWGNVISYIDRNPVAAGLATRPTEYPYGSAFHYARAKGPPWLRRDLVEAWRSGYAEGVPYDPGAYGRGEERGCGADWLVERRMQSGSAGGRDPLDDLVGAAPAAVRAWMESKARLADGTSPGWTLVSPSTLRACVDRRRVADPTWRVAPAGSSRAGWEEVEAGGLRRLCGLRAAEVAGHTGTPRSTSQERTVRFDRAMACCQGFREVVANLLAEALAIEQGVRIPTRAAGVRNPTRAAG